MTGYVYFVSGDEPESPIKIGFSSVGVAERIRSLQTGCAFRLRPLLVVEGTPDVEASFHALFAPQRMAGEWFKRSPELMAAINALSIRARETAHGPLSVHAEGVPGRDILSRRPGHAGHPPPPRAGRPRIGEAGNTLKAREPWKAQGMSRATWYRRQREAKGIGE